MADGRSPLACYCGGRWPLLSSCGLGARRDSLAIAIAIAPASTASPASWLPISRGSSGTVAAASATRTCTVFFGFTGGRPSEAGLEEGEGPTVGNRPDGLPGDTPVPDIGGKDVGGSVTGGVLGCVVGELGGGEVTTTSVAEPLNDFEPLPVALAVS